MILVVSIRAGKPALTVAAWRHIEVYTQPYSTTEDLAEI